MSKRIRYEVKDGEHLSNLFRWVNRHLTLMEGADSEKSYQSIPKKDRYQYPELYIPKELLKPVEKTVEEYLSKHLSPAGVYRFSHHKVTEYCSICLEKFVMGEGIRNLSCGHIFHKMCVDNWFSMNLDELSCPLCRETQYKDNMQ